MMWPKKLEGHLGNEYFSLLTYNWFSRNFSIKEWAICFAPWPCWEPCSPHTTLRFHHVSSGITLAFRMLALDGLVWYPLFIRFIAPQKGGQIEHKTTSPPIIAWDNNGQIWFGVVVWPAESEKSINSGSWLRPLRILCLSFRYWRLDLTWMCKLFKWKH
jgi:hypothetical protein